MGVQQRSGDRHSHEDQTELTENGHAKNGKARFDHVYDEPDPRPYFQTLEQFEYEIPAHGQTMFGLLVRRLREETGCSDVTTLDLCCSYGVNAALLNHDLSLSDLYQRYGSPEVADLSSEELADSDTEFYAACRVESPVRVLGVDTAGRAVGYALRAGLLSGGSDENLEIAEPSEALSRQLAGVDLITVTGGIGYISERTFARALDRATGTPWVASFALRWVPYEPITAVLGKYGLVTEQLSTHTFPQRRFADEEERAYVLGELRRMGVDTTNKEDEGRYHANFYLSRPAPQARAAPLEELAAAVV